MNITIVCRACQSKFAFKRPLPACPNCNNGWLDAEYELTHPVQNGHLAQRGQEWRQLLDQRGASLWRYRELLPLHHDKNIVSLGEGWTPLLKAHNLSLMLGHPNIYIKDERQGPTGSFKDRQAAIAISAMKEAGIKEAVVASTGNVAIAYSAYSARAGIKLWVFVTSSVPAEKMREVALYGSEVIKVAGTYDEAKRVAAEFAASKNLFLDRGIKGIAAKEAMKTLAFEVAEQLGSIAAGQNPAMLNGSQHPWRTPDWYLQAVSGGMGPVGVMKGFAELKRLGLVPKLPKLACFQTSGCAPMARSFHQGLATAVNVDEPRTDITTLATGAPGEAYEVLRELILQHGGTIDAITDVAAFNALHLVAKMDGISVEPATAVTFAGLFKLIREGKILPHETVVINCSGHTFPVEKHIIGEHYTRDMSLPDTGELAKANRSREEGLLTALEELDSRVQRIVLVEDNLDAARLIRRILQAQGNFLIDEAHDGQSGLRLIRESRPNLVILDLMMPELDGFGVVEAMKADPTLKETPIIVITAKELTSDEKERLDGKIKALLQKGSFMDSDLLNDIQKALP
ncbi:pyridoxal-phosphate dependent enzyme [Candidatus Leptofilum sp.]|uniref:pyridoxal-phosphate dependent enzyme n=1 Tax=Candidatus Leptofilum sp. TaxID=3241576 RepID=UPI003B5AAA28